MTVKMKGYSRNGRGRSGSRTIATLMLMGACLFVITALIIALPSGRTATRSQYSNTKGLNQKRDFQVADDSKHPNPRTSPSSDKAHSPVAAPRRSATGSGMEIVADPSPSVTAACQTEASPNVSRGAATPAGTQSQSEVGGPIRSWSIRAVSLKALQRQIQAAHNKLPIGSEQLADLKWIWGYVIDERSQDLILYGESDSASPNALHLEDFALALRRTPKIGPVAKL